MRDTNQGSTNVLVPPFRCWHEQRSLDAAGSDSLRGGWRRTCTMKWWVISEISCWNAANFFNARRCFSKISPKVQSCAELVALACCPSQWAHSLVWGPWAPHSWAAGRGGTLPPLGWVFCPCQTERSIHTPKQSKQTAKPSLHKLEAYATSWKMMGVPNQQKIPGTAAELGTKPSYCRSGLYGCSQYYLHSSGFAAGVFCCSLPKSPSWGVSQQEGCECVREQCFKWGFIAKYLLKTMFT